MRRWPRLGAPNRIRRRRMCKLQRISHRRRPIRRIPPTFSRLRLIRRSCRRSRRIPRLIPPPAPPARLKRRRRGKRRRLPWLPQPNRRSNSRRILPRRRPRPLLRRRPIPNRRATPDRPISTPRCNRPLRFCRIFPERALTRRFIQRWRKRRLRLPARSLSSPRRISRRLFRRFAAASCPTAAQ